MELEFVNFGDKRPLIHSQNLTSRTLRDSSLIDGVFANVADRPLEVQAKHHVEIA